MMPDITAEDEPEIVFVTVSPEGAIEAAKRDLARLPALMYQAEIPRNSMQAYVDNKLTGPIVWYLEKSDETNSEGEPLYYPAFYDLAGGINAREMRNHLQRLRDSGGNTKGKHGIGARLSALRASPDLCEWWSLKDGAVSGFRIWLNERMQIASQVFEEWEISSMRPEIVAAGHGTQVIFSGMDPVPASKMPSEAVAKWLSARWFDRPSGITMQVQRCRNGEVGAFVEVPSQKQALEALSEFSVDAELSDAKAKVYILKATLENVPVGQRYHYADLYRTKDGGGKQARPKAKFFVTYDNENYMSTEPRGVANRLRKFGITHGQRRVVMLLFPDEKLFGPNDLRTRIEPLVQQNVNDANLPMVRWAKEFNALLPTFPRLSAYIEQCAIGTEEQSMQIIDEIITKHALRLVGSSRRKNKITAGQGTAEVNPPKKPVEDPRGEVAGEKEEDPSKRKRKRRKVPGRQANTNKTSKKFQTPKVVWVEPDVDDDLYVDSGIYLPAANNGQGELQLNRSWKALKDWQGNVEDHYEELTLSMAVHYTEQATALIHVDAVMRSRLMKWPDPTADDFKRAMLMPSCRDMALEKIRDVSSRVSD